jgi:hypothetical protein
VPDKKDFNMGRQGVVIGGDNIEFSRNRRDAWTAYRTGNATPEQVSLLRETDSVMQEAVNQQKD